MNNILWEGVFPAVTTKFTQDNIIDLEMFLLNIDAQLNAGVNGLVLGGTLGEASTLKNVEKLLLLTSTVNHVAGRVPVIMNIAEQSTEGAIESAKQAESHGVNGFMLLPPMRYKADDRETLEYIKAIASSTDLPIMLYNNPVDYHIEIKIEMFKELQQYSNIQAVKESTRDISNVTRMRNEFGERFKILCGVDTLAMEELVMGADGWVAGLVCAFPNETVTIYKLIKAKRYDEARAIYRWFLPLLELDIHPKLVHYIKLAEKATGIGTEYLRPPRLPLQEEERKKIERIIHNALKIRPVLPQL